MNRMKAFDVIQRIGQEQGNLSILTSWTPLADCHKQNVAICNIKPLSCGRIFFWYSKPSTPRITLKTMEYIYWLAKFSLKKGLKLYQRFGYIYSYHQGNISSMLYVTNISKYTWNILPWWWQSMWPKRWYYFLFFDWTLLTL